MNPPDTANTAATAAPVITVSARAKINLCLTVLGRRDDGWHELDGVMHALTLADMVVAAQHDHLQLNIIDALPGGVPSDAAEAAQPHANIPQGEQNLIWGAAMALRRAAGTEAGAHITLVKRIPLAAGLGGGSADAAAVLTALNRLWQLGWSRQQLAAIGVTLGADVPFALLGGAARARGVGEQLQSLPPLRGMPVVLIPQPFAVLTADIFRDWRAEPGHDGGRLAPAAMAKALQRGHLPGVAAHCTNSLTPITGRLHPPVLAALADLRRQQPLAASMTGTGPTVFGLFADRRRARQAVRALRVRWPQARLTHLTGASPLCRPSNPGAGPRARGG